MRRTYKEKRISYLHCYILLKRILKLARLYAGDSYSEFGRMVTKELVKEGLLAYGGGELELQLNHMEGDK